MRLLAVLPFALQAVGMVFDEGYFHIRRGLPRWERIGHPIDTGSVLICMAFVLFVPFSATALAVYIALASFSSILVTKDEFVHKEHCPATENWLHAVLFTLHPVALLSWLHVARRAKRLGVDVIARWLDRQTRSAFLPESNADDVPVPSSIRFFGI